MCSDQRRDAPGARRGLRTAAMLLAMAVLGGGPLAASAQAADEAAYCSVDDAGGRQIWVSPVFTPPPSANALDMATAFHTYVGTLGGAGTKQCVVASRTQVEATRARVAEIMGKRVFGIRVYTWHDVAWTPGPVMHADAPAPQASPMQYVYCRLVDIDTRTMVTSAVVPVAMPRADDMAHFSALQRWQQAFGAQAAAAYRVSESPNCIASDTAAEAAKSLDDYRKAFRFSRVRMVELPWVPDAADAASPPAAHTTAAPAAQPIASTKAGDDDVEAEFWRRISGSRQVADYDDYLAAFPQGRHASIARLEARRLRGDAGSAPSPAAVPANAAPAATPLAARIAQEPFFQLPASGSASVDRSGSRKAGTVAVSATVHAQREAGSNLCRIRSTSSVAGVQTQYDGATWAGLLPLDGTLHSQSRFGPHAFTSQATAIEALEGQPFPLVEGHVFGYTFRQRTSDGGITDVTTTTTYRCVVGRTGPARAVVADMEGDATELRCTLTSKDALAKAQEQVVHWFSAVGCFVQDPSR